MLASISDISALTKFFYTPAGAFALDSHSGQTSENFRFREVLTYLLTYI